MLIRPRAATRRQDTIIHSKSYAVGDGVADDTDALNAFFANASAGLPVHIDDGTYKVTAGLTAITGNTINIDGDGRGAVIKYVNAGSTAPTIMTFGSASASNRASIKGFTVESATTLTGGYGVYCRNIEHLEFDIWCGDEKSEGWKLYNAAWFDGCTVVDLFDSHFYATNKGYIWSGASAELNNYTAFIKMASAPPGVGTAVHIGGGCGGWNGMFLNVLYADVGLLVDTSITSTKNAQIFMDSAKIDFSTTVGVHLNDALGTSLYYSHDNAWVASGADGVRVQNWLNGVVDFPAGKIRNNTSDGIVIDDSSITCSIGDGCRISANTGYGVNASVAVSITSDARFSSNGTNYHSNVTPTDGNGWSHRTAAFYATAAWTPGVEGSTTAGTQTFTTQAGGYSRVGDLVTAWFHIVMASVGGTAAGNIRITGLPFASKTTTSMIQSGTFGTVSGVTHGNYTQFGFRLVSGQQFVSILEFGDRAATGTSAFPQIETTLGAGDSLIGSITYQAAV